MRKKKRVWVDNWDTIKQIVLVEEPCTVAQIAHYSPALAFSEVVATVDAMIAAGLIRRTITDREGRMIELITMIE